MTPFWKGLRHRIEWMVVRFAAEVVPRFPRGFVTAVGSAIGTIAAFADLEGRRVALSNLDCVFRATLSRTRKRQLVRESYQYFARTVLDLFWLPAVSAGNFWRYAEFEGLDRLRAEIGPTDQCIFAAFHYGNFEWLSPATAWSGLPTDVVTQEFKNPLLDDIFRRLREHAGHTSVPRNKAVVRLYRTLRKGGRAGLLVDTTLTPHHPTVVIECFGLKTIVTVAHAWLYEKTGAPLIPLYCEPMPGGRWRIVAEPKVRVPAGATHQEIAQACWDAFEPVVRRNPAPWLWMYKHWRYRPEAADPEAYPFYANVSPRFEKRLREDCSRDR